MPLFQVSASGGYFTSTSTWVGGVVPPSANTSDIVGLATSGPLSMGGIGNRTVGMWDFSAYKSTITMTGSTTTITVQGGTFSMNNQITQSIGDNSGNLYRFQINPSTPYTTTRVIMNGYKPRHSIHFLLNTNFDAKIVDELVFNENGWLLLTQGNGLLSSATASVRARIGFDLDNGRRAYLQQVTGQIPSPIVDFPVFADLRFRNTSGGTNSVLLNSQVANSVVAAGINFILDGGSVDQLFSSQGLALGANSNFEYISGTISPASLTYILNRFSATYTSSTQSIKSNGIDWQSFTIIPNTTGISDGGFTANRFNLNQGFKAQNLIVAQNSFNPAYNEFAGSQSVIINNLALSSSRPVQVSNAQSPGTRFMRNNVGLVAGVTYSIDNILSSTIGLSYSLTQGGGNDIYGTAGVANIQLTNDCVTYGTDYQDINVVGGKKIYALTGTYSNTTNIVSQLPTGGGGGGGSFVFLS